MAKSTYLLALLVAVVVCTEAIRIDIARSSSRSGKHFPSITKSDPKCLGKGNGLFAILDDCTMYLKCVNGDSQIRKCPENFLFDSIRYCIPPDDNPDCGKESYSSSIHGVEKCPETYGIFPVLSDCHKYMICRDGKPTVKLCPPRQFYRDLNGACVDGDVCPAHEETVCKRANQLLPDDIDCRKYIKCVNFLPQKKECPPGTAFDSRKLKCSREQLEKCKNNDILNVEHDV